MRKIFVGIFLFFSVSLASIFVRIIFIEAGENDCMIEYVLSDEKAGYMYKLDTNMYHIDTKRYEGMEIIGITRGCMMLPYDKKFSFMAFSNTLYCGVVTIIS